MSTKALWRAALMAALAATLVGCQAVDLLWSALVSDGAPMSVPSPSAAQAAATAQAAVTPEAVSTTEATVAEIVATPGSDAATVATPASATETCTDAAPFGPDCPAVERPEALATGVDLVGILPASPRVAPVWSPSGELLAYAPDEATLAVRALPDYALVAEWPVDNVFGLAWAPGDAALAFAFYRDDGSSIGVARLGEEAWTDLLPGTRAELSSNQSKVVEDWLDARTVIFRVGCGTGCGALYGLDVETKALSPLVNVSSTALLQVGVPPYGDLVATRYLFSDDGQRLAATDWTTGLPFARVLAWPGPADPVEIADKVDGRYTEALSWSGNDLLFAAYPPGEPETWPMPAEPEVYVWNALSDTTQLLVPGAFWATMSPGGTRLAAHLTGRPSIDDKGGLNVEGSVPYVALFAWPERTLLATQPASEAELTNILDFIYSLQPRFSPDSAALAFQPAAGGLAIMGATGVIHPLVTGQLVDDIAWGGNGDLAVYAQQEVWILRLD